MILWLLNYLKITFGFKIPTVFAYTSTRMMLAAFSSFLITLLVGPFFIRKLYELKIGQTIRTSECPLLGELHQNKKDTPTMGGILILASLFSSLVLWMDWRHPFTFILGATLLYFGGLGAYDDYLKLKYKNTKGLSSKKKLGLQFLFAGILGVFLFYLLPSESLPFVREPPKFLGGSYQAFLTHLYIPFTKKPMLFLTAFGGVFAVAFFMFVVVGSSNAVNLTDGLDGLATGCLMMTAAGLSVFGFTSNHLEFSKYLHLAYIEGSGEIAIFLFAMVGALLGFLWYNSHPAQVFMGDTGSLSLGALIGVSALLIGKGVLLAILGGVFVMEALSVIIQVVSYRYRGKKRVFLCAPLHHHFEYKGWKEPKVVVRFWIVAFLFMVLGVSSIKFQ